MACDLCGKSQSSYELEDLRDCYQFSDVKVVCDPCRRSIEKHLDKVRKATHSILLDVMRAYIRSLKDKSP
jgi:hypothetical protein